MRQLPSTRSCFVCGQHNTSGLGLRFETDGEVARTRFVPRADHVGFQATLHGGIVSTILDEVMVWGVGVKTHRFAYCAELTVRFLAPVRPGVEAIAIGKLTANRRDRIYEAEGEIVDAATGQRLATSTGKYIPLPEDLGKKMLEDFIGDTSTMWEPGKGVVL